MIMHCLKVIALLCVSVVLAGCFGDKAIDRSCDDPKFYESARRGDRVRSPEGLDDLEDYREMPIPEATDATPRPAGSPCIDLPPRALQRQES